MCRNIPVKTKILNYEKLGYEKSVKYFIKNLISNTNYRLKIINNIITNIEHKKINICCANKLFVA